MSEQRTDESKMTQQAPWKSCCNLEYLLIGDLRALLSKHSDLQARPSLLVLLDRLILNLPNVLKLTSEDGYLSGVLERRPNSSDQVNALYQSNLDCISSLKLVRECLEDDKSIATTSKELELQLQNWIESFSAIRSMEAEMLQEAFTVDLGGES